MDDWTTIDFKDITDILAVFVCPTLINLNYVNIKLGALKITNSRIIFYLDDTDGARHVGAFYCCKSSEELYEAITVKNANFNISSSILTIARKNQYCGIISFDE